MSKAIKIGLGVLLPLVFVPVILDPVLWPPVSFLSAFSILLILLQKGRSLKIGPITLLLGLVLLLHGVSILWSFNISETLAETAKYASILSVIAVIESMVITRTVKPDFLLDTFLRSGSTLMILGVIVLLMFNDWGQGSISPNAIVSTMANKNLFGAALWFGLFSVIYLQLKSDKPSQRNFLILYFLIVCWLHLINSRAVLIASGAVMLHFLWILKARKRLSSITGISTMVFTIAFALSAFFSIKAEVSYKAKQEGNYSTTIHKPGQQDYTLPKKATKEYRPYYSDPSSAYSRMLLWKSSLQLWKEQPVLGTGPGSWRLLYSKTGLNNYKYNVQNGWMFYQRPHNEFIRILIELGIVGLCCFLMLIAWPFKEVSSWIKQSGIGYFEATNALFLTGALSLCFILFMDFSLERPLTFLFFILFLVAALYSNAFKQPAYSLKPWVLLIFPLCSLLLSASRIGGEYQLKESMLLRSEQQWQQYSLKTLGIENSFYKIDPFSFPVSWHRATGYFQNEQYMEESTIPRALKSMQAA